MKKSINILIIVIFFSYSQTICKEDTTVIKCSYIDNSIKQWRAKDTTSTNIIEVLENDNIISAYPNPSMDYIEFSFDNSIIKAISINIEDIKGLHIKKIDINSNYEHAFVKWDLQSDKGDRVSSGIYFLKIHSPDKVFTKKIIVRK